ncbi:MAG: NAD(P)H-hydrate epimerase [Peptoniphilus sp.]|nr:NAD(P)H-hydrate epimerase [Peptoniphilus sp.]
MNKEVISVEEMKEADRRAIEHYKIPSIVLMENAALAFFHEVEEISDKFTVVCSTGNNGGDGLAIARHLMLKGKDVSVYIIGNMEKMSKDFKINYDILERLKASIKILEKDKLKDLEEDLKDSMAIDSIFGTGLSRKVEGLYAQVIDTINKFAKRIVAVDIASGLNGDTGEVMGTCIEPEKTITFHKLKRGIELADIKYKGEVCVKYIGVPD